MHALPHLRAALIALHLFAIVALALPSAGVGLDRRAWSNPTVQEEFAAWAGRLNALGVPIDSEQLQDHAFTVAKGWADAQATLIRPFRPYYQYLGTHQSWRMFVAPHRYPARLHIDLDEGDGWRPLYVARSDTHTWRRHQLDQDRFRSMIFRYGWKTYQRSGHYTSLGRWLARMAAQDFPKARQLRTRFHVYRTPTPDEVRSDRRPEGRFEATRIYPLEATP